jgi:hypothetical protein
MQGYLLLFTLYSAFRLVRRDASVLRTLGTGMETEPDSTGNETLQRIRISEQHSHSKALCLPL